MALGPLDKRAIRTRCKSCAKRRIKCQGGRPCEYCCKKKIECVEQAVNVQVDLVILNHTPSQTACNTSSVSRPSHVHPLPIARMKSGCPLDSFINHFFTSFISKNEFGTPFDMQTIVSQFQASPSLFQVSAAIGALDISRKDPLQSTNVNVMALKSYRASVLNFQSEIQQKGFLKSDDGVWTTFFLSIFELMYDVSGEGFVKHILYGTSKILQLRGPESYLSGRSRSFFLTVRILEISRALIYSEPTFLYQESWKMLTNNVWENDSTQWHPKEALLDLMLECSELSLQVWDVVDPESIHTEEELQTALLDTATSGLILQCSIDSWNMSFQAWELQSSKATLDPRSVLAKAYYHAISIYLSGIFDYRFQYNKLFSPALSPESIQSHVKAICSTVFEGLKSTNLTGLLFFFPIRVAGARVVSLEHKSSIRDMLKIITSRSFVVADAFIVDLENLWAMKE